TSQALKSSGSSPLYLLLGLIEPLRGVGCWRCPKLIAFVLLASGCGVDAWEAWCGDFGGAGFTPSLSIRDNCCSRSLLFSTPWAVGMLPLARLVDLAPMLWRRLATISLFWFCSSPFCAEANPPNARQAASCRVFFIE